MIKLPDGYELATTERVYRLVVNVMGLEKQGKTHFALTAPDPIAYMNFDKGTEDVVPQFADRKQIYICNYKMSPLGTSIEAYRAMREKFLHDYEVLTSEPSIKTIVIDTGTDLWALYRLAEFGKLEQVMPHHYVRVNAQFRDLLNKIYDTDKNLIITHKLKKEYLQNEWTGKYEMSGFNEIPFLVQVNVKVERRPDGTFTATVIDCAQNAMLAGVTLENDNCSLPTLATLIYPETSLEHWS